MWPADSCTTQLFPCASHKTNLIANTEFCMKSSRWIIVYKFIRNRTSLYYHSWAYFCTEMVAFPLTEWTQFSKWIVLLSTSYFWCLSTEFHCVADESYSCSTVFYHLPHSFSGDTSEKKFIPSLTVDWICLSNWIQLWTFKFWLFVWPQIELDQYVKFLLAVWI